MLQNTLSCLFGLLCGAVLLNSPAPQASLPEPIPTPIIAEPTPPPVPNPQPVRDSVRYVTRMVTKRIGCGVDGQLCRVVQVPEVVAVRVASIAQAAAPEVSAVETRTVMFGTMPVSVGPGEYVASIVDNETGAVLYQRGPSYHDGPIRSVFRNQPVRNVVRGACRILSCR
jgi:hypothetical protein